MTDHAIVSVEDILNKARRAFTKNAGRDSHNMNPGSAAIATFQSEYDRLESSYQESMRGTARLKASAP